MIEVAKKAYWECDKCSAVISYDPEDIQIEEEDKTEYGHYSNRYYVLKTMYVHCPVCTEKHIIRTEECEKKSRSRY